MSTPGRPAGLPPSLVENPDPARWIRFDPERRVRVATGKVEIGQGIVTAIAQIAAEELDVALDVVDVLSGSSDAGPDELYTTSSLSVMVSGASVRLVCADVRDRMATWVAMRLNCGRDAIDVVDGSFLVDGAPSGFDYWNVAAEVDLGAPVRGDAPLKPAARYTVVGTNVPRRDLPAKLRGAAFIHDWRRPDLLHARIARQPHPQATLATLDEQAIRDAAGGPLDVLRIGDFVAFLSADEAVAERAGAAAEAHARWGGVPALPPGCDDAEWLDGKPAHVRHLGAALPDVDAGAFEQTYTRPYIAHASMGPSCALAEYRDGHLHVWSHGQGMHPLVRTLAAALDMAPSAITATHVQGPGCYGHNGADDAALDAALVARARPGNCVRVQWRRAEEFAYEPYGPSMRVTLRIALDEHGRPRDWNTRIESAVHVQRPGLRGGCLLAETALPRQTPSWDPVDPPEERGGGATRNAVPLYAVPAHRIEHRLIVPVPVRTSALRGLGAAPNVFAIESAMDELADAAGVDPLDYRLSLLRDERARRVLERVADMARWSERPAPGSGRGLGLGFARYKNTAAYAAVAALVRVDRDVTFERAWCVADAGLVVNPDGVINQLEGGIVQSASWTLKEQVTMAPEGVTSLDWESYPILRFSEVPDIDVTLLDAPGAPSLGVGECTIGPTAAALGNAVAHALGARIRSMPLTRDRIAAALLA